MESIDGSEWAVLIAGTGIQESLLVLALSKSGKKILHIDKNTYYGGSEAALSLQDAEEWSKSENSSFSNVTISAQDAASRDTSSTKLGFSRAYSLALAPHIIYTQSSLLPLLVSSRTDQQLEFLAVGSWFVYPKEGLTLSRVPSSREDLFADQNIDPRSKRLLTKFLRFVSDYENQEETWKQHEEMPFHDFLSNHFKLPAMVQAPFSALILSPYPPSKTTTAYALPRIARHLRSMGLFGPGFGAVVPKWGGLAEVAQVGCRGGAVGGAIYMLGTGLGEVSSEASSDSTKSAANASLLSQYKLTNDNSIKTRWTVGSEEALPRAHTDCSSTPTSRSISVISSPLKALFPALGEGSPPPAVAVVVFPSSSFTVEGPSSEELPPVNLFVHSSDTGECPTGQSIIYGSTATPSRNGFNLLNQAITSLLNSPLVAGLEQSPPQVLWQMQYEQTCTSHPAVTIRDNKVVFARASPDLAFDDEILEQVKAAWETIVEREVGDGFLRFPAREDWVGGEEE